MEYDLQAELGVSLFEYIRGERPWAQLYRFMSRLPPHGHFHASVMDDEESVEFLTREGGEDQRAGVLGWTPERELLATVVDVLSELHATLIQIHSESGKRPRVEHVRRPRTAWDRLSAKRAVEEHQRRVRMMTGR